MTRKLITRRGLLTTAAMAAVGGVSYAAYRSLIAPNALRILESAEYVTLKSQRLILSGQPLAREFSPEDMSPSFKANGTTNPDNPAYNALVQDNFSNWRLTIDGLVANPVSLSLADLKRQPQRTQITRHDCVEGWSAIGKWTGVPLAHLLQNAGIADTARFVFFHCADDYYEAADGSARYYESIDLFDAFHPQTILAHTMNDNALSVAHGAPLRLRVERQLGYKHAKYVMRIEVTDRLDKIGKGKGGFWPDRGYEWCAGI
jgi:DMSO/TMAO reductase YedYZ molybdopterin-dependent catalytic subunit